MTRAIIIILAASLLLVACGGGSDDSDAPTTAAATSTPDTAPTTEAPTTATPTTATPTTAAPTTEATVPATTVDAAPDLGPFCDASAEYYVTARAIFEYVDGDAGAGVLFGFAIEEANAAIDAAPTPEFAAEPTAARDALVELSNVLTPVGFDVDLADPNAVSGPFGTVTEINGALEIFLADGCDADLDALDQRARSLAVGIDAQYPDDTGDTPPTADVTDESGIISATVPGAWIDVRGAPDGDTRRLLAAADVDAFLASFDVPGVLIISADADDAASVLATTRDSARSGAEASGCTVSISAPYDDGVYTGQEEFLECPGGDAVFHLIGGTDAENETWFVMALVVESGDTTTRDLVGGSFFVD